MAITINTNLTSMRTQTDLAKASESLSDNVSCLSSGLRVRSHADDAAGFAIAEDFKAKISGLKQAKRNANDGVSLTQTADGASKKLGGMLTPTHELVIQSATEKSNTTQRKYLDDEFTQLLSEITRIAGTFEFNGNNLFNGDSSTAPVHSHVGTGNSAIDQLTLTVSAASALASNADNPAMVTGANAEISGLDTATGNISARRANIGAMRNHLSVTMSNLETHSTNIEAANSRIIDVDAASETARLTTQQILVQPGASMLTQGNRGPQVAL